jgi:hypothetical protein
VLAVSREDWDSVAGHQATEANHHGRLVAYRRCIFAIAKGYYHDSAAQQALAADRLRRARSKVF